MPTQILTIKPSDSKSMENRLIVSFECDFSNEQLQDFMIIEDGVKTELGKAYSEHLGHALNALTLRTSSVDTIIVERETSIKLRHLPESVTIGFQESDFTTFVLGGTSDFYTCTAYSGKYKVSASYPKNQTAFLETISVNPVQALLEISKRELKTIKNDS